MSSTLKGVGCVFDHFKFVLVCLCFPLSLVVVHSDDFPLCLYCKLFFVVAFVYYHLGYVIGEDDVCVHIYYRARDVTRVKYKQSSLGNKMLPC